MKNITEWKNLGLVIFRIDFANQPLFIQFALIVIVLSFITIVTTLLIIFNRSVVSKNLIRKGGRPRTFEARSKAPNKNETAEKFRTSLSKVQNQSL